MKTLAQKFKAFIFLASLLAMTSCFKRETRTVASGGQAPSSDSPVRWSSSSLSGGLNLRPSDAIINEFNPADDIDGKNPVQQMILQWNNSTTSGIQFFKEDPTATADITSTNLDDYRNDGVLGIYKSDDWLTGVSSQALAVTQYIGTVQNSGSPNEYIQLSHADIIMNYRDYNFSTDSSDGNAYDFHSVILHELGHFIGLGHVNSFSTPSVMQPYLGISDSVRAITIYDQSNIQSLYGLSSLSSPVVLSSLIQTKESTGQIRLPSGAKELSNGLVIGLIELRKNGECLHYENGKLINSH